MNVLLVTKSDDNECVEHVARALEARGARPFRLDTDRYPTEVRLSARIDRGAERAILRTEAGEIALEDLEAIWHRRLSIGAQIPKSMGAELRSASVLESQTAVYGALVSARAFTLDPLARIRLADHKLLQLRLARELGLELPRTLVSNDPDEVRAFAEECGGAVVAKTQSSFAIHEGGREQVVFTHPLRPEDLQDLDGLRYAPMCFQERVEKSLELRVTIVGERVFAASIDSAVMERSRTDWRREGLALIEQWKACELPDDVAAKLLRLMDALGLNYGAIDVIRTPDGRHVFLEINPAGEFFWLERCPGFPISEALADVLIGRAKRREAPLVGDTR